MGKYLTLVWEIPWQPTLYVMKKTRIILRGGTGDILPHVWGYKWLHLYTFGVVPTLVSSVNYNDQSYRGVGVGRRWGSFLSNYCSFCVQGILSSLIIVCKVFLAHIYPRIFLSGREECDTSPVIVTKPFLSRINIPSWPTPLCCSGHSISQMRAPTLWRIVLVKQHTLQCISCMLIRVGQYNIVIPW